MREETIGTADYLAPEQAADATTVDIRGGHLQPGLRLLFSADGQSAVPRRLAAPEIAETSRCTPPPVSEKRPEIPPAVSAVLMKMLAKKPEDRYRTPASVAAGLSSFCRPGGAPGHDADSEAGPEQHGIAEEGDAAEPAGSAGQDAGGVIRGPFRDASQKRWGAKARFCEASRISLRKRMHERTEGVTLLGVTPSVRFFFPFSEVRHATAPIAPRVRPAAGRRRRPPPSRCPARNR